MIKLIVDSSCEISPEKAKALGMEMVCMKMNFGAKEFIDKQTITNDEFYDMLESESEMPTTTLISVGEYIEIFEKYPQDDIIVITISSGLSGTYNSAVLAADMTGRKNIHVVDSKTAAMGVALIINKALELIKTNSAEDAAATLRKYADKVRIVALIDTLKYLVKGGRLSAIEGSIGGIIGIKPFIMVEDGIVKNVGKARGLKAGIQKTIDYISENYKVDYNENIFFAHAKSEDNLKELMKSMDMENNENIYTIGSVIGTHTGPGVIALAFFTE